MDRRRCPAAPVCDASCGTAGRPRVCLRDAVDRRGRVGAGGMQKGHLPEIERDGGAMEGGRRGHLRVLGRRHEPLPIRGTPGPRHPRGPTGGSISRPRGHVPCDRALAVRSQTLTIVGWDAGRRRRRADRWAAPGPGGRRAGRAPVPVVRVRSVCRASRGACAAPRAPPGPWRVRSVLSGRDCHDHHRDQRYSRRHRPWPLPSLPVAAGTTVTATVTTATTVTLFPGPSRLPCVPGTWLMGSAHVPRRSPLTNTNECNLPPPPSRQRQTIRYGGLVPTPPPQIELATPMRRPQLSSRQVPHFLLVFFCSLYTALMGNGIQRHFRPMFPLRKCFAP